MTDLINSFSQADLIVVGLCFLVLAYIGYRIYKQYKFISKIKSGSQDIITYSIKPTVASIDGPITAQGKHQVPPYYEWIFEFTDQWGGVRTKGFEFLEEIMPQETINAINHIKGSEDDKNWVDKIGLESDEIRTKRLDVVKQRLLKTIGDIIEVKQDSVEQSMILIDDPLKKFSGEDNNNAEEKRSKISRRAWFIISAICLGLLGILKGN